MLSWVSLIKKKKNRERMARASDEMLNYLNKLCHKEHAVQHSILATQSAGEKAMQISRYEGQILKVLLGAIGARMVLEIGMLMGYSTIWLAQSVLPLGGKVYTVERSVPAVHHFRKQCEIYAPELSECITCLTGDAHEVLKGFDVPLDAIFIDADKLGYLHYFAHAKRLLRPGGLVIADNVFLYGHVYGQGEKRVSEVSISNMQRFNQVVMADPEFESAILPTPEGMLVARRLYS
jgi:predicted O-methyltransferase YrrM